MKRYLLFILLLLVILNISLVGYYLWKKSSEQVFFCPVPREYCKKGKLIEIEGRYFGIGFDVPAGTPILAAISGLTSGGRVSLKDRGIFPTLTIKDKESGYAVNYIITEDDYLDFSPVSVREEVCLARKGTVGEWGVNLIFRVWSKKEGRYDTLEIEPKDLIEK